MPYGSLGPVSLLVLGINIVLGLVGLFVAPKLISRCVFRPYEFARGMRRGTLLTMPSCMPTWRTCCST